MKYDLARFRFYLLGSKRFVIYTDRASFRTATQSPHFALKMDRWISIFAEYNFEVKYEPGKQNSLADLLSPRPDDTLAHVMNLSSPVTDSICTAYVKDKHCVALLRALGSEEYDDIYIELSARLRARLHRYSINQGMLYYIRDVEDTPCIVVPHDEVLKYRFYMRHMILH